MNFFKGILNLNIDLFFFNIFFLFGYNSYLYFILIVEFGGGCNIGCS